MLLEKLGKKKALIPPIKGSVQSPVITSNTTKVTTWLQQQMDGPDSPLEECRLSRIDNESLASSSFTGKTYKKRQLSIACNGYTLTAYPDFVNGKPKRGKCTVPSCKKNSFYFCLQCYEKTGRKVCVCLDCKDNHRELHS